MKTIILLSGKKETGKSTAAGLLVNNGFIEQSFAEELKDQVYVFTKYILGADVTYNHFQTQELKNVPVKIPFVYTDVTPRYLMQKYGTEIMRNCFSDTYWVDQVIDKIIKSDKKYHVIVDNRFPNEIEGVIRAFSHSDKVVTVRIKRDTGNEDNHISETALDSYTDWDYVIENNYSMDLYERNLISMLLHITEKGEGEWTQQYL